MRRRILEKVTEMIGIIDKCDVCYVGMTDKDQLPYVVPFNFGIHENYIYLHSGPDGRKMDILKSNPDVCVVFSTDHQLGYQSEQVACSYGMRFRSVMINGRVEFIEGDENKIKALDIIMKKYTTRPFTYSPPAVKNVAVFRICTDKMTGREYGYM